MKEAAREKAIDIVKRSQAERILIAEALLSSVWEEMEAGKIDRDILQNAVFCQCDINRIVWKLNEVNGCYPRTRK